ncbi:Exopolysaccharide biosynthesis protein [Fictibacillus enclensis]|uniref:Metallophosphoesterase n=1 Tax=Fictibacillus enclensis TaxID=1017270 RepID=A0A0V8J4S6_9BACL|nr:phosphodiester glycosidase family protein [Fictibacillus enclensis]KSU81937.1 hypothetical protein AS030_16770 [Fictibacillus enclensis]SCC28119.1 Exopolysaccharide biosynthesis protein [Fictibacillus enclensis]
MKIRWKRKMAPSALVLALVTSAIIPDTVTALGEFHLTSPLIKTPINEYTADLAPGVQEKHYSYENQEGKKIESFVVDVDLQHPGVSVEAGTPNDKGAYGLQPVRAQAKAADSENHKVVAAVNADFYNMATGEPLGVIYKDGRAVKEKNMNGWNFFGIKKSGQAIIGNASEYEGLKAELKEALGGNAILVKNKQIYQTPQTGQNLEPRTAVGIKEDGDVFFAVIDGRQEPYSAGITMKDLAQLMIDLGAVQALNLDGGGSSTFATRELGGDTLEVDNLPSDRNERSVANTWLVAATEPSDHIFHSAYIKPYDASFTQGSAIDFEAKGRDKSMASAPLPESGMTWELSNPSFGDIDEHGRFTSNGKTGQLSVIAKHDGKEVGRSPIEIETPDQLYFSSTELTVGRNSKTKLDLVAEFHKRKLHWNRNDVEFDIPEGMGTIDEDGVLHTGSQNVKGTITARFKNTHLEAKIHISVGQLPVILHDFEQGAGTWNVSTANRGEKGNLSVSQYPRPVRFGDKALKLDFDLTNAQSGTTLGVYAGPGTPTKIEGNPTGIGMWVYGTPEAQGYWLRMYLVDGNGKNQTINLTEESPGINWTGWKYIEAEVPSSFTGPFKLSGSQAIRMMSTKSGITGPMTKGTLYVDNIRAVYGEKVDDLNSPVIESVSTEDKSYTTKEVNITAKVHEYEDDPFKTGIDWEKIRVMVDGRDYSKAEGHFSFDMDGSVSLTGYQWADGTHKVMLMIPDKFGNQAIHTSYFTVSTNSAKVELNTAQKEAYLGETYTLDLNVTKAEEITGSVVKVQMDKNFPVKDVEFADGFSDSSSNYDENTGILTLNLKNSTAAGTLNAAAIHVSVPSDLKEGSEMMVELLEGTISYQKPVEETFNPTFSAQPAKVPVKAAYQLNAEPILIGKPATLSVKDNKDSAVIGADIYAVIGGSKEPTRLGQTDANGGLTVDSITNEVNAISLYTVKDGRYSFPLTTQSYLPLAKEEEIKNIHAAPSANPLTTKALTWMSSPLGKEKAPYVQYAIKADYERQGEAAFRKRAGTYKDNVFNGELDLKKNGIIRVNTVTLKGLKPSTQYVYRTGNGPAESELHEFETQRPKKMFEFAVLGDTQSPSDLSHFDKILADLNEKKMPFIIHVGDLIDEASKFKQWDDTLSVVSKYKNIQSTDMISVLGNHEYMGDNKADLAKSILGLPQRGPQADQGGTYAVDYNNMHIAVLGFTSEKEVLEQQLQWLKQDMRSTDKPWKILVTHQPPYYTNPFGGNEVIKEKIPPVADELGIDMVFSGHDHSYGRTKKLKAGKEDSNGTVYVVAGTTGNKHYDAVADEKFEYVNMENIAISLQATVEKDVMTISAITSDGENIDEFTVKNNVYEGK